MPINGNIQQVTTRLNAAEIFLRQQIARPDASPFMAHVDLNDSLSENLKEAAKQFVGGSADRIARFTELHPAAGVWLIAHDFAEQYGQGDDHAIYPRIAESFGVRDTVPNQYRAALNREFRRACKKLGLGVAAFRPIGAVDDYIFQAGVAHGQLRQMLAAFLHGEQVLGAPSDDDTQRLNAWEDQAVEFAPWTLSRLRNILRQDETAYHAHCFVRARRGETNKAGFEALLNRELQRVIAESPNRGNKSFAIPTLLFHDEALFISAPVGSPVVITLAGRERTIPAGGRLALSTPWVPSVSWRQADATVSAPAPPPVTVFPSGRILVAFDADTGRMLRAFSHSDDTQAFSVDAKQAVLISTSSFAVNGVSAAPLGSQAFGLYLTLNARTIVEINGGSICIVPPSRPAISVDLARIGRSAIGPLCGNPRSVSVSFFGGKPEGQLELTAEHPAASKPLLLPLLEDDDEPIDLTEWLPSCGVAGPLKLAVRISDTSKTLVRTSFWVWPGLRGLVDGIQFDASGIPPNLSLDKSRHCVRSIGGQLSLAIDEAYRHAEIAFKSPSGTITSFEIPRPGVSLSLVSDDGTERFLAPGTIVPTGPESTESLVIRSTDLDAGLDIRGQLEPVAFGRSGVRRFAMASFSGAAPHDEIRLVRKGQPSSDRVLLRVFPTTAPIEFALKVVPHSKDVEIRAEFSRRIDAVKLIAREIATQESREAAVPLGRWPVEIPDRGLIECVGECSGTPKFHIRINAGQFPPGMWIGELLIREEGGERWEALVNSRGDRYIIGISPEARFPVLTDADVEQALFLKVSDELNKCIAQECWDSYGNVITTAWKKLGLNIAKRGVSKRGFLAAAALPLPVDASSTWVPIRHPIELAPDMFGAEAGVFRCFENAEVEGGSEMAICAQTTALPRLTDAFAEIPVDVCFFQGFGNFPAVNANQSIRLRDFSFQRYRTALLMDQDQRGLYWRPRDRRLSAAHHGWCLQKFMDRVERVAPQNARNNGNRLPSAATIAYSVKATGRDLMVGVPDVLTERLNIAGVLPGLFSMAARASRNKATVEFWQGVASDSNRTIADVLQDFGFLLRLAPELFGFYLLLWELVRRGDDQ